MVNPQKREIYQLLANGRRLLGENFPTVQRIQLAAKQSMKAGETEGEGVKQQSMKIMADMMTKRVGVVISFPGGASGEEMAAKSENIEGRLEVSKTIMSYPLSESKWRKTHLSVRKWESEKHKKLELASRIPKPHCHRWLFAGSLGRADCPC